MQARKMLSDAGFALHTVREARKYLRSDAPARLRDDLGRLQRNLEEENWLTSKQAAELLGVSSPNTVKNWLEGGHFPSALRTPGGHWRFLESEVLAVRDAMERTRRANAEGKLGVPDFGDEEPDIPGF